MRFGRNRGKGIRELVVEHLAEVEAAVSTMTRGVRACLEGRPWNEIEELAVLTHRAESRADDLRRAAERELVRGAFLAGTRRSLLETVKALDQLANAAEAAMFFLSLQRVALPELLHPLVRDAAETMESQMGDVQAAVVGLLDGHPAAIQHAEEVDRKESRVDELQRRMVARLFATDLPLAEKILAREFVDKFVEVSDRAEDVADLVVTALAVRHP